MRNYQVCNRCVMDTSASDIVFDEEGFCNYCSEFLMVLQATKEKIADHLSFRDEFISKVKKNADGKEYDCIVGVSGGIDSSYALYLAAKNGLRPLAVHLDNGWNSELASHNIANLVNQLGVDLYTHVIDWEENRDLQLSFFKANVVDIEMLMDNAMKALCYQQAAKYGLKYILSGGNQATEGVPMPPGWNHMKYDVRNIRAIQKKFGKNSIKTHPLISTLSFVFYNYLRRIQWISFLDYFQYSKDEALEILKKECCYKAYPYKHYESVFTRFYQAYILPRKFGFDKRRVHLSTLIVSGQMLREEALELLKSAPYPDPKQEIQDRIFVMKKLGFSEEEFDNYMSAPGVPHEVYGTEKFIYDTFRSLKSMFKQRL